MAKILITGSADGLGQLAAKELVNKGHLVILHARNRERVLWAKDKIPSAMAVVTGDLSLIEGIKKFAEEANALGPFDAIIHNAGVYQASYEEILTVNVLAPYVLTCLILKPRRLIYLSSELHLHGKANPENFKRNPPGVSYSDSKLYLLMLCKAVARLWPEVYSNAVDPGWVPTKMGGRGAPDDLQKGYETQSWLAVSDDSSARVSGRYFYHQAEHRNNVLADDINLQEQFINTCMEITGVPFPTV